MSSSPHVSCKTTPNHSLVCKLDKSLQPLLLFLVRYNRRVGRVSFIPSSIYSKAIY